MNRAQLEDTIRGLLKVDVIEIEDLTGTSDHWRVMIVSPDFEGKTKIEQHKLIFDPLQDKIQSNEIHALTLKTFTPEKWAKVNS